MKRAECGKRVQRLTYVYMTYYKGNFSFNRDRDTAGTNLNKQSTAQTNFTDLFSSFIGDFQDTTLEK